MRETGSEAGAGGGRDRGEGTGGDPAGGADPGGTRGTKPGTRSGEGQTPDGGETVHDVESGDRNDMTAPDPIKR